MERRTPRPRVFRARCYAPVIVSQGAPIQKSAPASQPLPGRNPYALSSLARSETPADPQARNDLFSTTSCNDSCLQREYSHQRTLGCGRGLREPEGRVDTKTLTTLGCGAALRTACFANSKESGPSVGLEKAETKGHSDEPPSFRYSLVDRYASDRGLCRDLPSHFFGANRDRHFRPRRSARAAHLRPAHLPRPWLSLDARLLGME